MNISIGAYSGETITSLGSNIFISEYAGQSFETGDGNILIGYASGGTTLDFRNQLFIDHTNTPLIYGEFDNDLLQINGS